MPGAPCRRGIRVACPLRAEEGAQLAPRDPNRGDRVCPLARAAARARPGRRDRSRHRLRRQRYPPERHIDPDIRSSTRKLVERGGGGRVLSLVVRFYERHGWWPLWIRIDARGGPRLDHLVSTNSTQCFVWPRGRRHDRVEIRGDAHGDRFVCRMPARRVSPTKSIRWKVSTTVPDGSGSTRPSRSTTPRATEAGTRSPGAGRDPKSRNPSRIDAQGETLSARIDARSDALSARIDAQGEALSTRLDALVARLDVHIGRHAG